MKNIVLRLKHAEARFQKLPKTKKYMASAAAGIVMLFLVLVFIVPLAQNKPERSVASFCTYLKTNQTPQDWKSDKAYYKELEARAPAGVYQQTKTIRQTYEQMVKHPEGAVGLDLSVAGTGNQFNNWVSRNCYQEDRTDPQKSLNKWIQDFQKSQDQDQIQPQTQTL